MPGFLPDITKNCHDQTGIRVHEEKCSTCPFRAGSSFAPQMQAVLNRLKTSTVNGMLCHETYYPEELAGAICRGSYDAVHSKVRPSSWGDAEKIVFVPLPENPVALSPYNEVD